MTNATSSEQDKGKGMTPATAGSVNATDFRDEMDSLWDFALSRPFWPLRRHFRSLQREAAFPPMDVYVKDGKLQIRVEVPGMTEKDVEISVEADMLVLSGEKTQTKEVNEKDFHRSERTYGSFYRRVALPAGADVDNIAASIKAGVLEVEVPLKTATGGRKIEIKPSNGG